MSNSNSRDRSVYSFPKLMLDSFSCLLWVLVCKKSLLHRIYCLPYQIILKNTKSYFCVVVQQANKVNICIILDTQCMEKFGSHCLEDSLIRHLCNCIIYSRITNRIDSSSKISADISVIRRIRCVRINVYLALLLFFKTRFHN